MNTLIVYDNTGRIFYQNTGTIIEPVGLPFIIMEIPLGKRIKYTDGIGVDVSVTPNVAILEDIPKTEIEVVQGKLKNALDAIDMLVSIM